MDKQGFEVGPFATSVTEVNDDTELTEQYYRRGRTCQEGVGLRTFMSTFVLLTSVASTGANRVMPVVHIARRQPSEKVLEAEKVSADTAPVIAPSYDRSGEQRRAPSLVESPMADSTT